MPTSVLFCLASTHEVADHALLHVLGGLDMAVIEVGAFDLQLVEVRQRRAIQHRHGRQRHAVEDGRRIRETVEVDRVRIEQVGPEGEPDIGQVQVEFLALRHHHGRSRDLGGRQRGQEHLVRTLLRVVARVIRDLRLVRESEGVEFCAIGHYRHAHVKSQETPFPS